MFFGELVTNSLNNYLSSLKGWFYSDQVKKIYVEKKKNGENRFRK